MHDHTEQTLRALRSTLALLFALAITWLGVLLLPVFGVSQDILITPAQPTQNGAISPAVQNVIVIGDAVIRENTSFSYNANISRVAQSDVIRVTTFAREKEQVIILNSTLTDELLQNVTRYYPIERGITFTRLGQQFTTLRYWQIASIILVAVLLGTYIAHLIMIFVRGTLHASSTQTSRKVAKRSKVSRVSKWQEYIARSRKENRDNKNEVAANTQFLSAESQEIHENNEVIAPIAFELPAISQETSEEDIITNAQTTPVLKKPETSKQTAATKLPIPAGVPGNLPIVEAPLTEEDVANGLTPDLSTATQKLANPELTTAEPSDDDLKRRLNQLLKGEL